MIPAGPERDRLICKHKKVDYLHKPYSTDITAAMELWEEMVQAGLMPTLKTIWIEEGEYGYRLFCANHMASHEAWKVADAISGAWLMWKEGE